MLPDVDIATRLKLLRTALKREQRQVAKKSGYSVNTLSGIESGRMKDPRPGTIAAIAGALGVRPEALTDDVACFQELARIIGIRLDDLVGPSADDDDRPVTHREVRELLRAELRAELHRMGESQSERMGEDAEERQ